jgi:hypothetical protein
MRIATVNSWAPLLQGGAGCLAAALNRKVVEYSREVILVRLPWSPPEKIFAHMPACPRVRLRNADGLMGPNFPACYLPRL